MNNIDSIQSDEDDESDIYDINEIKNIDDNVDINNYNIKNNLTRPILNKYEKTTVIIMRCEQINSGFLPLIDNFDQFNTIEEIVEEELKQNKIPFIIKRNCINQYDYWKLSDMNIGS